MDLNYYVEFDIDLIKFLSMKGFSKNKVKTYVRLGFVYLNEKCIDKLPVILKKGDNVTIRKKKDTNNLDILYEDNNYLIVNKEAGLLTISTGRENSKYESTLYRMVREYLNKKGEYAFIVNRIDKETSGIVVFVKSEKLKNDLQSKWNDIVISRGYIAVVCGKISKGGVIDNYLYEDKMTFSHSTHIGGKRAITYYEPIRFSKMYTMLDVHIKTGRKNQIRVHMSEMGYPIVGDKKYYSKINPLGRLGLHHYELIFLSPIDGEKMIIRKEVPREFYDLFS